MKASGKMSPRLVETAVIFSFLVLIFCLIAIPLLQPTVISLGTLMMMTVLHLIIAVIYGVYIRDQEPPLGSQLLKLVSRNTKLT